MTIYTKNNCPQCHATLRWLNDRGFEYTEINTSHDPSALAHVKSLGIRQLPYVDTGESQWSGFQPQQLAKLLS
ncbi:glutaredoxin domain-containing protein [Oenococcus sicerae]|uniref:glutaredoxin domain-containing protein n=1 Tax=Oenococcus sicerae TaxID=2203724 RepID=UPI0039E87648